MTDMRPIFFALLFSTSFLLPGVVVAGLNEGLQAVRKGNYDLALNEFRPLAEKGDVNAQASLGAMYQYGQGMERNYLEANKWYRLASDHGHPVAMSLSLIHI